MKVILFADNTPDFLDTRAEFLEQAGYQVLKARTPEEARNLLREAYCHLAVLDIRLENDDDDKDVSGLILAKDPDFQPIPKIILTSFPTHQAAREAMRPIPDGLPPAVDFLDKEEGPEALIQAIERAFDQYLRIDRDLQIRWGRQGELTPAHLLSRIRRGLSGDQLAAWERELEDLLRRLFSGYYQVTLSRILSRREGWLLLTVFAYPDRSREEQFVMSCGQREVIQEEKKHYESLTQAGDRTLALVDSLVSMHLGVITYRLAGCKDVEEITTLTRFYRQQPAEQIIAAVQDLFRTGIRPWYERGTERRTLSPDALFQEWLGGRPSRQDLEQWAQCICRDALAAGIRSLQWSFHGVTIQLPDGIQFSYPNPFPYLLGEHWSPDTQTLYGTIHGRLDGSSVLVSRSGQTWVVDFGRVGFGPLVRDFVSLEASVRFDMLEEVDIDARHELERRLLGAHSLGEPIELPGVTSEIEKALRIIGEIRAQAAKTVGPHTTPYLASLLFCILGRFMKYQPEWRHTRGEALIFAHALLSLTMICQRLMALEDRTQRLPPQARVSLWLDEDNQEVWVEGRPVSLTPQGFRLLQHLYTHANRLCRRETLAKEVFDLDLSGLHPAEAKQMMSDTINSAIRRLREDIEPDPDHPKYIQTVRGSGYKLVLPPTPD